MSRTAGGLTKVAGEKLLYHNSDGWYFLRKRGEGIDTDVCLDTQKKPEAIKARDAYLAARGAAKAGIAFDPNSSKARVSLKSVVERYQADGYPDANGNPRIDGRHLEAEKTYCATLLSLLPKEPVGEIDQDKLDRWHVPCRPPSERRVLGAAMVLWALVSRWAFGVAKRWAG